MSSRIEQLIDEIEDYIDNCKYQPLSNTKIIVNKEEIDELIRELRTKTPEELKKYQKVVSNQQAILNDAKEKAKALIDDAAVRTNEMLSQNAIMQQAYAQADEVVKSAYQQAQDILSAATNEANAVRTAAVDYMDNMLASYENLVNSTMRVTQSNYESFYSQLSQFSDIVLSNRMELKPPTLDTSDIPVDYINNIEETGEINAPNIDSAIPQVNNIAGTSEDTGDLKLDLLS